MYLSHYQNDHQAIVGTLRNFDPVKQYYILTTHKNPTRPSIVLQEVIVLADDDECLPSDIPHAITHFCINSLPW